MAGVFFPSPEGTVSVDFKRELSERRSAEIARQIRKSGERKNRFYPISSRGGKLVVRLAADANVLLSALIGAQAGRALRHPAIEEILATETTGAEMQEYTGQSARGAGCRRHRTNRPRHTTQASLWSNDNDFETEAWFGIRQPRCLPNWNRNKHDRWTALASGAPRLPTAPSEEDFEKAALKIAWPGACGVFVSARVWRDTPARRERFRRTSGGTHQRCERQFERSRAFDGTGWLQ